MTRSPHSDAAALSALQERAKELNCIYAVDEILARGGDIATVLSAVARAIPEGFQHPSICSARIRLGETTFPVDARVPRGPLLREAIRPEAGVVGEICVQYESAEESGKEADFLVEESRLLNTLAERVGVFLLTHGHLAGTASAGESEWRLIIDFLAKMDVPLLERLTSKMLTHLRCKGVSEAEELAAAGDAGTRLVQDNQPIARDAWAATRVTSAQVFAIAARALDDSETLSCIRSWMSQEKISFLTHVLEDQGSSLEEIVAALERFKTLSIDEESLPYSTQATLRVGLLRRFFTDDTDFINTAKPVVRIDDFHRLTRSLIHARGSHGRLGGKSGGLFLAERLLEASELRPTLFKDLRVPRTWYIASDALLSFLRHNNLEGIYDQKYSDIRQVRQQYPYVIQVFKNAAFPPELEKGLATALDELGAHPLVVRSSSLLEDRTGAAFAGKYKSLFLGNVGTRAERLRALEDAVAEVYASIFGPDPIEYRAERNLLDLHEEMGIMIQQVVGRRVGRYYLPAFAGVAFSSNEFRWSPRIRREDGLMRMVLGLGTRAVDRVSDDFPVLLAPGQPGLRAATTPDEIVRYSPRMVDVIDLHENRFVTVPVGDLLRECGNDLPLIRKIVSILEHDRLRKPAGLRIDFHSYDAFVTFEGLATDTPFMQQIAALLKLLRSSMGKEIDLEFASDGEHLYLLQCRPQSQQASTAPPVMPRVAAGQLLFSAHKYISNGRANDIQYVVYVNPAAYGALPDVVQMREIGRAIGRLNRILPRRKFVLIGPGRWGSRGDIRLGVSVTYSDINNASVLIEVARKQGNYVPELSFGTHFFQDLVEAEIRYLPLFPDEAGNVFDEDFLLRADNQLPLLLPEYAALAHTIHVVNIPAERARSTLHIVMNGIENEAIGFFEDVRDAAQNEPAPSKRATADRLSEPELGASQWGG